MLTWQKSPPDWYAMPRSERAFMKAIANAKNLLDAMVQHDMRQDAKEEAEREAKRRGRHGRR